MIMCPVLGKGRREDLLDYAKSRTAAAAAELGSLRHCTIQCPANFT